VASQVEKEYMARKPELIKYIAIVRALERIQWIHPKTYSKIKKCRSRQASEGCSKQFTNTERDVLPSLKVTSNRNSNEGTPNSLAYSI
jgi:hypothetical protein